MSVLLAWAMSQLLSHLPGLSLQSPATQGSRTALLPMEAAPGKPRETPRIVLIHIVVTCQEKLSYSIVRRFC